MTPLLLAAMTLALPAQPGAAPVPTATVAARVFVSGHSLVDEPLPSNLAAIAASLGLPVEWNRQYIVGSSLRDRARGRRAPPGATGWDGYRQGANREGEGMDVLAEWRAPRTVSGPYDTLLITEQHRVLDSLFWNDTVAYLRHHHDRFVEANPRSRTWFYEPWLALADRDDPSRWIDYERAASPIWQCVVTRVNTSLEAEGRADRIAPVPAAWALAFLVERALRPGGVPGVSASTPRATLDALFADDVHLTPLGAYYASLVSFAYVFDRDPDGAWAPPALDADAARALQAVAREAVQAERARRRTLSLEACHDALHGGFVARYAAYTRDAYLRREAGEVRGWLEWARNRARWHWLLRRDAPGNPLRFDPSTDRQRWLPAPPDAPAPQVPQNVR
jgi:hypothetical protein